MKKLCCRWGRWMLFSFVLWSLLPSCQKDTETTLSTDAKVQTRSDSDIQKKVSKAEKNVKQYISCFNGVTKPIDGPTFEKLYGELNDIRVNYRTLQGEDLVIFPLLKDGTFKNLLVHTPSEELYFIEPTPNISDMDIAGTVLSHHLAKLFQVPTLGDDQPDASFAGDFPQGYQVELDGAIVKLTEQAVLAFDPPPTGFLTGKVNELCQQAINQMLPYYANAFDLPLVDPFDYTDLIYDAIAACHPSGPYCVCPIPTCVLENLIGTVNDPYVEDQLKLKYIQLDLYLDDGIMFWLESQFLLSLDIYTILTASEMGSACSNNPTDKQMLRDMITTCAINWCSEEDFYTNLADTYDYIIETEYFTDNPKIKCIWDKVNAVQGTLFCSTIGNFMDTPDYDLFLYVGNHPLQCGRTLENYPPGSISISFDAACIGDRTEIELAKTILHEGIHAEMYRVIKSLNGGPIDPDDEAYIWEEYRQEKEWQHEVMADLYLDALAGALSEYDNAQFSIEHYKALAWQGLDDDSNGHPMTVAWDNLSAMQQADVLLKRQEVIAGSPTDCN